MTNGADLEQLERIEAKLNYLYTELQVVKGGIAVLVLSALTGKASINRQLLEALGIKVEEASGLYLPM